MADVDEVAVGGPHDGVYGCRKTGAQEENTEHKRAGDRFPFHPRGQRQTDEGENDHVGKRAEEDRAREPQMLPRPRPPGEAGFDAEENQTGYPCDQRDQPGDDAEFPEYVFDAGEGTAEIERESVVGEVGGDERRSGERGQEHAESGLDVDEDSEISWEIVDQRNTGRPAQET